MAVVMHDTNGNMQNEWEMTRWPETGTGKKQKWSYFSSVIVLRFLTDFVENDVNINK